MKYITLIIKVLLFLSLTLHASNVSSDYITAYWHFQKLYTPSNHGVNCNALQDAIYTILPEIGVKDISFTCFFYGAEVSLRSIKRSPQSEIIDKVTSTWKQFRFLLWRRGLNCKRLFDALSWLLPHLDVRNVYHANHCGLGTMGAVKYSFEALVPSIEI